MIVDRINRYLSSNETILNDSVRYDVEKMAGVSFRRQFMENSEREHKGKLYLSGAGKCARQLAYGYHGFEPRGKKVDSRSKIVFFMGDLVEFMIIPLAKLAGCNLVATGLQQTTVSFKANGEMVYGHPDGLLIEPEENFLVEIKSMSSYGFDKFQDGDIDDSYLAQVNCYLEGTNLKRCVMVAVNKDSGVLHEQIVTKDNAIVEACRLNLKNVLNSSPGLLPDPKYQKDEKGFYPWQCLYCAYWGHCRTNAEEVLVKNSYKLKEKESQKKGE